MRDRLIELLESTPTDFDGRRNVVTIAEHRIKNGVVVLHCKVGDRVYQTDGTRIYELEILDVSLYRNMPYYETDSVDFDVRAIGRSVFLTREEAEQALKGRSSDA